MIQVLQNLKTLHEIVALMEHGTSVSKHSRPSNCKICIGSSRAAV